MIRSQRTDAFGLLRITAAIFAAAVLIVTAVIAPSTPTASAAEKKTALFGTVVGKPQSDRIDVVTRSGAISLKIDDDTKIDLKKGKKKGKLKLSDVGAGMTVAGYYTEGDDGPVAEKLTFVARKQKKSFEHVIGVVLERKGKTFTVKTSTGELVEIESADDDQSAKAEPGSMIATVVEHDATTGEFTSTALQTAQETVERLSKSISSEISIAQKNLLEIRITETAAVHMTRLYETLDEIQADTQARIEAAYAEYRASYEATLNATSGVSLSTYVSGNVLNITESTISLQSISDGTRWHLHVTGTTSVELSDGAAGTIADIVPGMAVRIDATPNSPTTWPFARVIRVIPADDLAAGPPTLRGPADDTIAGTIVLVQDGPENTDPVVVVVLDDGTDSAASLTADTVVVVDGEQMSVDELEPGQDVEIVLADDGFSAEELTVIEPPVEPTPVPDESTPSASVAPPEYTLIGTLRSVDDSGVVLDDVRLTLDNFSTSWDVTTVGQQVELQFYVDDAGRLVVKGTKKQKNPRPQAAENGGKK